MKCVAPGRSIKTFGKAIHCLARIGEEIYFEGVTNGLTVRTVNTSRSAYSSFLFNTAFFSKFSLRSQSSGELRCKVSARSCISVFKNLTSLEKSVDEYSIELKFKEGELVFILYCKYGIKKTYNLSFQECEALHAIFNKNTSIVHLTSNHKLLSDCTQHFNPSVSEVCLRVVPEHAILSNFVEEDADMGKVLLTELKIANSEFDRYDVALEREVTFCLKELRAILTFQDAVSLPIDIYFDDPGKPIILTVPGDGTFQGDFVMATLVDQNSTDTSQANKSNRQRKPTQTKRPPPRNIYNRSQHTQKEKNPFTRPKTNGETSPDTTTNRAAHLADESLNLETTAELHELKEGFSPDNSITDEYIPPSPLGIQRPSVMGDHSSPPQPNSEDEFDLDDTVLDDELLASLSCNPSGLPLSPLSPPGLPLSPHSPPGKRFKRLSDEDDTDSVIPSTNYTINNDMRDTVVFCEDSD